jgi:hypothetical protein
MIVTRYERGGFSFTLPVTARKSKSQPGFMEIMLSQKMIPFNSQNLNPSVCNEGGDDSAFRNKVYGRVTSTNQIEYEEIRLVEFQHRAETTVSGGYDRFYIRSTTGKSRSVTVAHGTYADGTEIAVALQTALTTQASDLDDCDVCGRSPQIRIR